MPDTLKKVMAKKAGKKIKNKRGQLSYVFETAACGEVRITFNSENEIKTKLHVPAHGQFAHKKAKIAEKLWAAYKKEKTQEWRQQTSNRHAIVMDSGERILAKLPTEERQPRERFFYTVIDSHPCIVEIRTEGQVTMIKIAHAGNGRGAIMRRDEIRIKQELPGQLPLHLVPGPYGKFLTKHFNGRRKRFAGVFIKSTREKITMPVPFRWKGRNYVIDYERARDFANSVSLAGHTRDIIEFEGEVKKVFLAGQKTDLKESSKALKAAGLTEDELQRMMDKFLKNRLERFLEFSNGWLRKKGYRGCAMVPVAHSKSQPEMDAFHDMLKKGDKKLLAMVSRLIAETPDTANLEFPNPALNAARLHMRHCYSH